MFETRRLHILPARLESLIAEFYGQKAVARVLGLRVPASWPPELLDEKTIQTVLERLKSHPEEADWWLHHFVIAQKQTLVGVGGYKGPPDEEGAVEILYSILPEFRRQGYASEAVHALVEHAFDVALVKRVTAHTWPDFKASVGVLERCGFLRDDEGSEGDFVRYVINRGQRPILPPAP